MLSTGLGTGAALTTDFATLRTDTTNNSGNTGLQRGTAFTVEAKFDLVIPDDINEGYGLRLTDRQSNQPAGPANGDDTVELSVRNGTNGLLAVQLRDLDFPARHDDRAAKPRH